MSYTSEVLERVIQQNPDQKLFIQAVKEVLETLSPAIERNEKTYRQNALLERLTTPDRQIQFRVAWVDDNGIARVNNGFRIQQRHRPLQGRSETSSLCQSEHPEVPWF